MHNSRWAFSAVIGLAVVLLLFGIMGLSAQVRVEERLPSVQETIPAPTPTHSYGPIILPPPESELRYTLEAGPERFCPGWNLWYELSITNVGELPVTNLVISDVMPVGVWAALDGEQGTVAGAYDEATRTMRWQVDMLEAGQTVVISCVLRTYSTVADGSLLQNTFTGMGFNLPEPFSISKGLLADRARCQPSATPTSEPTPVGYLPTPDQVYTICLPVIAQ